MTTMFGPGSAFSLRTSSARSPLMSRVLFHDALSRVLENTTFGRLFIRSATAGAASATFVAGEAADLRATYELRLGEERFSIEVDRATLTLARGAPRTPDAVIATDPATLRAVVFGDQKLADAPVELQGDRRLARTFFRLFARPRSTPSTPGRAPAG
jgi:hypothetical protein